MCKNQIATIALSIALAFPAAPALAGGGLSGMSTEVTQLANNAELIGIYAKEAESVMVQINQYMTMLQNLQQLPAAILQDALGVGVGELAGQMQQYLQLYRSVSSLRQSAQQVADTLAFHGRALSALDMNPSDYLSALPP